MQVPAVWQASTCRSSSPKKTKREVGIINGGDRELAGGHGERREQGRRRLHAGRLGGSPGQPRAPVQERRLDRLLLHRSVRAVREDGVLRDSGQPGDLPDGQAPPGDGGGVQQRHQLVRRRLHHALDRSLRRRRLPRPLLDLRRRLRHLLLGNVFADAGGDHSVAEAAAVRRRCVPAGVGPAAGRLLRRPVHHRLRQWRHQAQHLDHRRRPVRRVRPTGEDAQDVVLQLVDVHHLRRHPLLLHRPRLPPGQHQLVRRLRHPHARPPHLHLHLPRRHAAVPAQGAAGQPVHSHGQGGRRRRLEVARGRAGGRQGAARAGARGVHEEAQVPDRLHQHHEVPEQGCREGRFAGEVEPVHGDPGGGDEADHQGGPFAGDDVRAMHAHRPDEHPLREAGQDDEPPHRAALPDPSGQPRRVRHAEHARRRRRVRPALREGHPEVHQEPPGHPAAEEDGRRAAAAGAGNGDGVPDGEPAAELRAAARPGQDGRGGAAHHPGAAAAVRADGRGGRVPGGGQDRVLLRPGAREHEEPRHGHVADGVRRRQRAQQLPPLPRVTRHAGEGRPVGDQQPQRLAPRLLLWLPHRARRRQRRRLRRAQQQVLLQGRVDGDDRHCHGREG